MEIREYKNEDISQIKDLLVELQNYVIKIDKYNLNILSHKYRNDYFKYLVKDCKKQKGKIYVATEDNKVYGVIAGFVQTYSERDKLDYSCPIKGEVAELIVNNQHRSLGLGHLLLNKIEEYFKDVGCEFVQLDVFAYNDKAKGFYLKHNYEERMTTLFKPLK